MMRLVYGVALLTLAGQHAPDQHLLYVPKQRAWAVAPNLPDDFRLCGDVFRDPDTGKHLMFGCVTVKQLRELSAKERAGIKAD
jgi:hypothetical protein